MAHYPDTSKIIVNANHINQGRCPCPHEQDKPRDFYLILADTPEEIHAFLLSAFT